MLIVATNGSATAIPPDPLPKPCERPNPPPRCGSGTPKGTLASVERTPAGLVVTGSANDPDAPSPVEVAIQINGEYLGTLWATGPGGAFAGTLPPNRSGTQVCALAVNRNSGDDALLGCRPVTVIVDPFGHVDDVVTTAAGLRVRGWVIDPDTTGPVSISITVDGTERQTASANTSRTDVGNAYPTYGPVHGFEVTLPGNKMHTNVCVSGINIAAGTAEKTTIGCGRDKDALSVLNFNMQGTNTDYEIPDAGTVSIPWRHRWARLAAWMADQQTLPDIIQLQEVPARKTWFFPFPHDDPTDYESLLLLIKNIKDRTGGNYRIAYLAAPYVPNGVNSLYQGRAVIYNADRVRNTTTLVNSWPIPHDQSGTVGVHMRRSFPCVNPSPELTGGCALIDGAGSQWTSSFNNSNPAVWQYGPQAAMFELIGDPGKHVLIFNVHRAYPTDPAHNLALKALVDQTWNLWRPRTKLLPPIITGDFNGTHDMLDFDTVSEENVDFVLAGKRESFDSITTPPAESKIVPTRSTAPPTDYCGSVNSLISDHCGLYVQFLPTQ